MRGELSLLVNITFFQQQRYKITERNNSIDSITLNKSENVSFKIMISPNNVQELPILLVIEFTFSVLAIW